MYLAIQNIEYRQYENGEAALVNNNNLHVRSWIFLFNSNLLQDVAYGTSTPKFDNGSTTQTVLTLLRNHAINVIF